MPRKVKLAVLRARHDSSPTISDRACIEMLMTSTNRRSLLNYWTDNTDGYLDFVGSNLFSWVDVTFTAADLDANRVVPRNTQAAKAYAAASAAFGEDALKGFDGFVVITFPGAPGQMANPMAGQPGQPATIPFSFDGGTGGGVPDGKAACVLPVMASDHTFMVHEIGHVLGFKHTYGVLNNGIEWDNRPPWDQGQVYGDPYDIMSSASFGTRNRDTTLTQYIGSPAFAGPAVAGWPNANAVNMGPAPARAHVHLWDDKAIPATRVRHLQTPGGNVISARIYAAGRHQGSPELIVIHPQNEDSEGRGRCYLEYRAKGGWDEGMDLGGTDLARQAVVAHTLADAAGDGVRCWYRGRILVPLEADTDLDIAGTPLTVRAVYADVEAGYVDVEIGTNKPRGVDLTVNHSDPVIASTDMQQMGTPCGDTITWGTWITQSSFSYLPHTYGFGGAGAPDVISPLIAWTVGGVPVPADAGTINVPAAGSIFSVDYALNPATFALSLASRGGEKYAAPVVATATEPGGGNATTATASFSPLGYFTGFKPGDLAKLDHCMGKYIEAVRLRPQDLLIPPGPDPFRQQWQDRVNQSRVLEFARQITRSHPGPAAALSAVAAMRYAHIPAAPARQGNRAAVWLALGVGAVIGAIFGFTRRPAARY